MRNRRRRPIVNQEIQAAERGAPVHSNAARLVFGMAIVAALSVLVVATVFNLPPPLPSTTRTSTQERCAELARAGFCEKPHGANATKMETSCPGTCARAVQEENETPTCIRQVMSMQAVTVQVPHGVKGGMQLPAQMTSGAVVQMKIPPGLQPGMFFETQVPNGMSHAYDYCEIDKYGNFKHYPECERCRLQAALAVIKRNSASLANADLASLEPVKSVVLPPPAPPSSPPPPPPAPPPLRPSPLMPSPSPVLSPLCIVGVLMLLWWPSIPSQVLPQPRAGAGGKSWPITSKVNLTGAYCHFGDAVDKSWQVASSGTTIGEVGKKIDLTGAHLSYGGFGDAIVQLYSGQPE